MRFLYSLTICFLTVGGSLWGQIDGYVFLFEEGQQIPAPLAEVYWEGSEIGTTTDENGYFQIQKPAKFNRLSARFTGFETMTKVIISRKGSTNFVLIPKQSELDEVSVEGSALATQVNVQAAGLHYEINTKELRKAACCNLAESFETNASIDVSFSDAITGTKQIEMLGLAGKYALIQRENVPFARALNSQDGMAFIPGPFIQSIQVTKGLSSVINGFESLTGQINVEYFKPETGPKLALNIFGNAGARNEVNLMIRDHWKDDAKAHNTTMLHYSSIPFAQDRNNDGFADISTGRQLNGMHRTHYTFGDSWEGQVGISLVDNLREGGQIDYLESEDSGNWGFRSSDQRFELFGKTGYVFQEEQLRTLGTIYSFNRQSRSSNFGDRVLNFEQSSFYLNTILHDFIGNLEHQFKTGLSFQADIITEEARHQRQLSPAYLHNRTELVPGAFFEYNYIEGDIFSLVLGARADYNSFFEQLYFSPRLQAKYQLSRNTTLRLSGGRGQRSPNRLAENVRVFASSRNLVFSDEYTNPEVAWNSGFSWSQNIIINDFLLRWNTDIFYTWFESKVVLDLDYDPLQAYVLNRSGSQSLSILSQLDYTFKDKLDLRLAYKYLRSEEVFLEGRDLNYGIPLNRAFFNAAYTFYEDWKIDGTLNWFGQKRLPKTSLSPVEFQQAGESPSFFTVNAQVNYTHKRFEFFAGVDNLLNFRQENPIVNSQNPFDPYFDSNFVWGPIFGRNLYLGMYFIIE